MISNRVFISMTLLLGSLMLGAQENNSSPYSCFGIGDINYGEGGRTLGMASTAISLSGRTFLNTANPASLAALDTNVFILDLTGSAKGSLFRSGSDVQKTFSANFTRFTAGLRLTKRWSSAVSLQPYSTVSYKSEYDEYVEGSEMTTLTTYEGSGGVTRLSYINSYALTAKLSLGADVMLLFGNIDRNVSQGGITINQNSTGVTMAFVAGLQYNDRLSDNLHFSAGLTYGHSSKLNLDNNINVRDASDNIVLYNSLASSSIAVPRSLGAGISVTGRKIMVAADYRYQKWSLTKDQLPGFSFTDTHKLSTGIAFVPSRAASMSYLDRIEYRAGFSVANSYLTFKNVNPLNIEITSGMGLPLRNGSLINLGLSWGRQGTVNEGLVRENFVRFSLGLSLTERMFLKRMYD
jgi:hypothetical protein